eukprot:2949738-Pyramimonas_sp.AAC.1
MAPLVEPCRQRSRALIQIPLLILGSLNLLEAKYPFPYCQADFPQNEQYDAFPHALGPTHTLSMVQVIVRHGDRTPIAPLPYNRDVEWNCDLPNRRAEHSDIFDLGYAPGPAKGTRLTLATALSDILNAVGNGDAGSMLYNEAAYLIPGADEHPFAARFWNGNCTSGQLTSRGFQQLQNIGAALREIYVGASPMELRSHKICEHHVLFCNPPSSVELNVCERVRIQALHPCKVCIVNVGERSHNAERLGFLEEEMKVDELYLRSTDLPRTQQSAEGLLLGLYPPRHRPE